MNFKTILIVILIFLALIAGIGIGFFLSSNSQPLTAEQIEQRKFISRQEYYYDIPDILIQIKSESRKSVFVKLRYVISVYDERHLEIIQEKMPFIVDRNIIFLRELNQNDLYGSAGIYLLKEELLRQALMAMRPSGKPADILIKEFLVQ